MEEEAHAATCAKSLQIETGATGLEPATSGVTDRRSGNVWPLELSSDSPITSPRIVVPMCRGVVRVMTGADYRTGNPCSAATSYYAMGM
jgi:hypothetical protein